MPNDFRTQTNIINQLGLTRCKDWRNIPIDTATDRLTRKRMMLTIKTLYFCIDTVILKQI